MLTDIDRNDYKSYSVVLHQARQAFSSLTWWKPEGWKCHKNSGWNRTVSSIWIQGKETFVGFYYHFTLKCIWMLECILYTSSPSFFFKQITNLGKPLKSFAYASLNIFWPKENSLGKWLLYLTHVSTKGVQSVPCSPVNEVNPLKHVKVYITPPFL